MAAQAVDSLNRRRGHDRRAAPDRAVAADIAAALERGEIELFFQPQYAAADNRVIGAEALARWRRPGTGLIGGEELFALAARAGQVTAVSRTLAQGAMTASARWAQPLRLSLNVTATDIAEPGFAEQMAGMLGKTGFAPERLTLEITEQSLVDEIDQATLQLDRIAALGIHIALDDFGAGFCHFGYLKRLPLHALKLDRSMVDGITENPRDLAVLRGIVAMAHALGLEVIAEGIESEAQRAAIVREGCTAWQGFLGAEPMTAEAFATLVSQPDSASATGC
jgi:EAL domain-containing protein (putative c-di-GMP-specific phosphodiesterase class I)